MFAGSMFFSQVNSKTYQVDNGMYTRILTGKLCNYFDSDPIHEITAKKSEVKAKIKRVDIK